MSFQIAYDCSTPQEVQEEMGAAKVERLKV